MMLLISAEIGRPDPGAQAPTREEKGDPDLRPYFRLFLCYGVYSFLQATTVPTCSAIVPGYIVFSIFYQSYLVTATLYRQA